MVGEPKKTPQELLAHAMDSLRSQPEHKRKILAMIMMFFGSIAILGLWFSSSTPIADLRTPAINPVIQLDQDVPQSPEIGPASGITESFKGLADAFIPENLRDDPMGKTKHAGAAWSTEIISRFSGKAGEISALALQKIETVGLHILERFILYTSRVTK